MLCKYSKVGGLNLIEKSFAAFRWLMQRVVPTAARRSSALLVGAARHRGVISAADFVQNDTCNVPNVTIAMGSEPPASLPDPYALVQHELRSLDSSISEVIGSNHPVLAAAASHFFELAGKRFRPTLVHLASMAAGAPADTRQKRLAEIAEIIHAAALLHDDVTDLAEQRRGVRAAQKVYGNKVAVLAGDFLLARASVQLARLNDCWVVEMIATVIEERVHGEVMHASALPHERLNLDFYLRKTFRRRAALMSTSCEAAAILGGHEPGSATAGALKEYGRHLGISYQLVDDILDFEKSSADAMAAKPALDDGGGVGLATSAAALATAPVLFAAEEHPQICEMATRRFGEEGDVAALAQLVASSHGVRRAKEMAEVHARRAAESLGALKPSAARDGLLRLCFEVLSRRS